MKILCYVLSVICPLILIYLIGSFIILSFDIREWDKAGRAVGAISSLILIGFGIAATADEFER